MMPKPLRFRCAFWHIQQPKAASFEAPVPMNHDLRNLAAKHGRGAAATHHPFGGNPTTGEFLVVKHLAPDFMVITIKNDNWMNGPAAAEV
jgi:hypothetical protein